MVHTESKCSAVGLDLLRGCNHAVTACNLTGFEVNAELVSKVWVSVEHLEYPVEMRRNFGWCYERHVISGSRTQCFSRRYVAPQDR